MIERFCLPCVVVAAAAGFVSFSAHAQTTPPTGSGATEATRNSAPATAPGMPPGATSTSGNKGAVPAASGAMEAKPAADPASGATRNGAPATAPGMPPGAASTSGNKAAVPASGAMGADQKK